MCLPELEAISGSYRGPGTAINRILVLGLFVQDVPGFRLKLTEIVVIDVSPHISMPLTVTPIPSPDGRCARFNWKMASLARHLH
jgi:hypothetical protein